MRPRRITPDDIAVLMEDFSSNFGQDPTASAARMPADLPMAAAQVTDGVGKQRHTEMRECVAESCTNNLQGRTCGLSAIEINREGGCGSYEPRAEQCEDDDVPSADAETIIGISAMMPAEADHPAQLSNMHGKFNPGAMM